MLVSNNPHKTIFKVWNNILKRRTSFTTNNTELNMEVITTNIDGVFIIEPRIFKDDRGYFYESWNQKEFNEKVRPIDFVQDNQSKSSYGVLRG